MSFASLKRRYLLKDGSIYWHRLYYDVMPKFMCNSTLPGIRGYNLAYYLVHPHEIVKDYYRAVKWMWQRAIRGWSERDAWGWCTHHAEVTVQVLKYLRKHKHGYPIGLTPAKWTNRLDLMIDGFQAFMDEENDVTSYKKLSRQEWHKLRMRRHRKLMYALTLFRTHYYSLWD